MALWHKRSQEEIFASFGWWEKGCFLGQMTGDRCDYIQACVKRVLGEDAVQRHRILEVGWGGGLICEEMARRGATMVGVDPSQPALETAREHAQPARGLARSSWPRRTMRCAPGRAFPATPRIPISCCGRNGAAM